MGHGDEIAVVDINFPAALVAASTITGKPLLMAGVSAARAVEAVLSVTPLDTFVPYLAGRMQIVGYPHAVPPVQREAQQALDKAADKHVPLVDIERFEFYERAKERLRHPRRRRALLLRLLHLQERRRPAGITPSPSFFSHSPSRDGCVVLFAPGRRDEELLCTPSPRLRGEGPGWG